jgi:hypothetical protein
MRGQPDVLSRVKIPRPSVPDARICLLGGEACQYETRLLFVPKICQEYRNVSKYIEIHRNPGVLKNRYIATDIHYFLRISIFRRFLHTVKGRAFGSPLARASYPRASTAEVDPRALPSSGAKRMRAGKPGAPVAVEVRGSSHLSPTRLPLRAPILLRSPLAA